MFHATSFYGISLFNHNHDHHHAHTAGTQIQLCSLQSHISVLQISSDRSSNRLSTAKECPSTIQNVSPACARNLYHVPVPRLLIMPSRTGVSSHIISVGVSLSNESLCSLCARTTALFMHSPLEAQTPPCRAPFAIRRPCAVERSVCVCVFVYVEKTKRTRKARNRNASTPPPKQAHAKIVKSETPSSDPERHPHPKTTNRKSEPQYTPSPHAQHHARNSIQQTPPPRLKLLIRPTKPSCPSSTRRQRHRWLPLPSPLSLPAVFHSANTPQARQPLR